MFTIPTQPQGTPSKEAVDSTDDLPCELDYGTTQEQLALYREFTQVSNLTFSSLLSSGGKSVHGHIKLDQHYPIDEISYLRRLLIIGTFSDAAVENVHQPMRIPGFYRSDKEKEQTLLHYSYNRYTYCEALEGLKRWFEHVGLRFPVRITDEWWRRVVKPAVKKSEKGDREELIAILERGIDAYEAEQQALTLANEARKLNANFGSSSLIDAVASANATLGEQGFNVRNHGWVGSSHKKRGNCTFHESSSGNSAWIGSSNGDWLFSCGSCGFTLDAFRYWQACKLGYVPTAFAKGAEWAQLAKEFLTENGVQFEDTFTPQKRKKTPKYFGSEESLKPAPSIGKTPTDGASNSLEITRSICLAQTGDLEDYQAAEFEHWKKGTAFTPDVVVNQKFFDMPLPAQGEMSAWNSQLGTGKTYSAIDKASVLLKAAQENQQSLELEANSSETLGTRGIIWIAPLNNLNISTVERFNSVVRTKYRESTGLEMPDNDSRLMVWVRDVDLDLTQFLKNPDARLALCPDSFNKIDPDVAKNKIVIVDEADLVCESFLFRNTAIKGYRDLAQRNASGCFQNAYAVVLMSGSMSDTHVEWYTQQAPEKRVTKVLNTHQPEKKTFIFVDSRAKFDALMSQSIDAGEKVAILSDGKDSLTNRAEVLDQRGVKNILLTSQTGHIPCSVEFRQKPNETLDGYQPSVVQLSPTVSSGFSIDRKDYFDKVFLDYKGVLLSGQEYQFSARVRDANVPCYVFVPQIARNCSKLSNHLRDNQIKCDFASKLHLELDLSFENAERTPELEAFLAKTHELINNQTSDANADTMAKLEAVWNFERFNLEPCLRYLLQQTGHEVKDYLETEELEDTLKEPMKAAKETLTAESYALIYAQPVITEDRYRELEIKLNKTPDEDAQIKRYILDQQFPDIQHTREWKEQGFEFIQAIDKQQLGRKAALRFMLSNPMLPELRGRAAWEKRLEANYIDLANIKSSQPLVKASIKVGFLELLQQSHLSANSEAVIAFIKRIDFKLQNQFGDLKLSRKNPMKFITALAETFGYKLNRVERNREKVYTITDIFQTDATAKSVAEMVNLKLEIELKSRESDLEKNGSEESLKPAPSIGKIPTDEASNSLEITRSVCLAQTPTLDPELQDAISMIQACDSAEMLEDIRSALISCPGNLFNRAMSLIPA